MSDGALLISVDPRGVATVTLNRPERRNAFDDVLIADLNAGFGRLAADPAVRAVVLTGTGSVFSAGADLTWMRRMASYGEDENRADALALAQMLDRLNSLPKPVVARVNGAAIAGGVGLVCCCDVAVAAAEASFAIAETRLGLIPATIGPYVVAAIGARAARRYFLTGESFRAAEALRLGLVRSRTRPLDAGQEDPRPGTLCCHRHYVSSGIGHEGRVLFHRERFLSRDAWLFRRDVCGTGHAYREFLRLRGESLLCQC